MATMYFCPFIKGMCNEQCCFYNPNGDNCNLSILLDNIQRIRDLMEK